MNRVADKVKSNMAIEAKGFTEFQAGRFEIMVKLIDGFVDDKIGQLA